jgi:DNA-binding transcriptional MerR regulator
MEIDSEIVKKISYFYCDKQYSMSTIAEKLGISFHQVRYWLEKNNIPRRNRSEAGFLNYEQRHHKFPAKIKHNLTSKQRELLIASIMLYWAEGSKKNNPYVAFSNSDPKIIKLFLRFLREICGICEKKIKNSIASL